MPKKVFASTQGDLARIFGVSRVTIMDWVQRGAPKKTARGWDVEAFRVWRQANMRPAKWTGKTPEESVSNEDALASGPDSPALDRYRLARAKFFEYELGKQERQLIDREEMHALLVQIAAALRSACETLQRVYGVEARRILEEALDETDRKLKDSLGSNARQNGTH